jgi:hypothetical protein
LVDQDLGKVFGRKELRDMMMTPNAPRFREEGRTTTAELRSCCCMSYQRKTKREVSLHTFIIDIVYGEKKTNMIAH